MKRFLPAIFVIALFAAASVQAQSVFGHLDRVTAHSGLVSASGFNIKFCKAVNGTPSNQCVSSVTNTNGDYSFNVNLGAGNYYGYAWVDAPMYWGSSEYPTFGPETLTTGSNQMPSEDVFPRAKPAEVVSPFEGEVNVKTTIILQWKAGLDFERDTPTWPVRFDIWASGYEFPEVKVFEDIACPTAHTTGQCSLPVSGLHYTTRYQWRLVAKMRSGPVITEAGLDPSYHQTSPTFHFSTEWDPATPYYTIETVNGWRMKAAGGGGSTFLANAGGVSTYETQFKFEDLNGGALSHLDEVCIYTNRNFYPYAVEGFGTVGAESKSCDAFSKWIIERVGGSGTIGSGTNVAFRHTWSGYYMSATNGGGGSVTATALSRGSFETFTIK